MRQPTNQPRLGFFCDLEPKLAFVYDLVFCKISDIYSYLFTAEPAEGQDRCKVLGFRFQEFCLPTPHAFNVISAVLSALSAVKKSSRNNRFSNHDFIAFFVPHRRNNNISLVIPSEQFRFLCYKDRQPFPPFVHLFNISRQRFFVHDSHWQYNICP